MLGDDVGPTPPIKGICRTASIALRKANLAKETGDELEELGRLRSFNRTVVDVLHAHPMYARKKEDEEVAELDAELGRVRRRIEALGGRVTPRAERNAEAAPSIPVAPLVAGGGKPSLLERRRLSRASSRASSRAGSRMASRAPSAAPSRDASPERATAEAHAHVPHSVVADLSRRLAAVERGEEARVSREAETEARLAELARRAADAEAATRAADARAETAETLVWELQEALRALSPALEGSTGVEAARDARVDRLEARVSEVDDAMARGARWDPRQPPGPAGAGALADLEARVLPTRVAELEQRVAELAEASAASTAEKEKTPAPEDPERHAEANGERGERGADAASGGPRSPGEPFSAEVRDLHERVARLEHVDVGSAEWAHAAETKAATALERVDALEKAVDAVAKASASRAAPEEASDAQVRAAVAALQARVRRAEAAAAEALDLAASTSPGTARAKTAVPELRNRIVDVEAAVEAQAARVSEVEMRVNRMSSAPPADGALEARLAASATGAEALQNAVPEADARHREAATEQANPAGEVVTAIRGAAEALPMLDRRMQALEEARAEHAEALATSAARVAALETDVETGSRLSSKLAERARATRADLSDLKETVRQSVSAAAVKTLIAAVSGKISRLARETADTVDAMKRERKRDERARRSGARPESSRTRESRSPGRETRALAEDAAAVAERATERAESAHAAAKEAGALAETAAAAPARIAGELADAVESLREARATDATAAAELEMRVRRLEGTSVDANDDDDEPGRAKADADVDDPERPAPTDSRTDGVSARDWEPRVEALAAAVASAAEGIAALRERLEVVVASRTEDGLGLTNDLARAESGAVSERSPSVAAFGAAHAAAGVAETLAEAVARLQTRMAVVERRAGATETAADAKADVGAGADASHGSGKTSRASREGSKEDTDGEAAETSGSGASEDPRKASTNGDVVIASEAAATAAPGAGVGESADPSDADLVERARLAASIARRAVRDEAARLGITLGGEDPRDADAEGLSAEDACAELSQRAEDAKAADRELAAELATVCALVEKEEARRETLRAALVSAGDAPSGGTDRGVADEAVAVAARREWAACMEAQLRRLRAAAREAEARNAATAEELAQRPGGLGTRSGEMRAARAAAARREAAIADRLTRVARRVDAAFGPEIDGVESFDKENAGGKRPAPWGAGPGLKAAPFGSTETSTRHSGSRVDTALSRLERRVEALTRAAAIGAPILGAVPAGDPASLSARCAPGGSLDGVLLELRSLRQMTRRAQTELGALSGRVETVETKLQEAGRLERDLRTARLSEKRADALSSMSGNVAADAARASERAAAAEREAAASRARCAEVADSVASQREALRRVALQVDGLVRDVDVSARAAKAAADRARGQARSANASAKSAEARTLALAGQLSRVARHVGLRGVGDELRAGVLWEELEAKGSGGSREQEDAEDKFEITAFASDRV